MDIKDTLIAKSDLFLNIVYFDDILVIAIEYP